MIETIADTWKSNVNKNTLCVQQLSTYWTEYLIAVMSTCCFGKTDKIINTCIARWLVQPLYQVFHTQLAYFNSFNSHISSGR